LGRRISIDLLISAREGVMECVARCWATNPTSLLLNLIGLLILAAVALYAMRGSVAAVFHRVFGLARFARSEPSLFQKCLAVHIQGAQGRSALE
jgi:hypothetical protein